MKIKINPRYSSEFTRDKHYKVIEIDKQGKIIWYLVINDKGNEKWVNGYYVTVLDDDAVPMSRGVVFPSIGD